MNEEMRPNSGSPHSAPCTVLRRIRRSRLGVGLQWVALMGIILQPLPMAQSYWTDSDGNGTKQWVEDPPAGDSWFNLDNDGDEMTNGEEAIFGSDPYRRDSDLDGLTDKDERDLTLAMNGGLATTDPWLWDSDGDGYSDHDEYYHWLQGTPRVHYPSLNQYHTYFDADGDGIKNPEDPDPTNNDRDGDGILNWLDSYMDDPNNGTTPPDTTTDTDGDGISDYYDPYPGGSYWYGGVEYGGMFIDSDGDTIPDPADLFPNGSYWYGGAMYAGIMPDRDGDGLPDWADNFPDGSFTYEGVDYHAPWLDGDGDGVPNGPDPFPTLSGSHMYGGVVYGGIWQDADSDSIPDWADPFPAGSYWYNAAEYGGIWVDQDNDGIPDPADLFPTLSGSYWYNGTQYGGFWQDADYDGVPDGADLFPNGSYWYQGTEYAGLWVDTDGDWIPDPADPFPNGGSYWYNGTEYAGPWQDSDTDGIPDASDSYPNGSFWHNGTEYGGIWVDSDIDGIPDPADGWPNSRWNGQPYFGYNGSEYAGDWVDRDGDGVPDPADSWQDDPENGLDSDCDGLDNYSERTAHHTDPAKVDTDDDFLTDYEELLIHHTNPLDATTQEGQTLLDGYLYAGADADGDGLPDLVEEHYAALGYLLNKYDPADGTGDLDGDGITNRQAYERGWDLMGGFSVYDYDGDRINNVVEDTWAARYAGTALAGRFDKTNFADAVEDPDEDGLFTFEEAQLIYNGITADPGSAHTWSVSASDGQIHAWRMDVDDAQYLDTGFVDGSNAPIYAPAPAEAKEWTDANADGMPDGYAFWVQSRLSGYPPTVPACDAADQDGDGMSNEWEHRYYFDVRDPANVNRDEDNDGLTNLAEFEHNTHPRMRDSDGDGFEDGYEVSKGSDPTLASSNPISLMQLRVASVVSLAEAYLQVRAANGSVWAREAAWAAMKQEVDAARAELAQLRSELTSPVLTQQVDELTENVENSVEPAESLPSTAVVEVASASSSFHGDVYASVRRDWIWSIDPMTGVPSWSGGDLTNGGMDSSTRLSGGWSVSGQTTEENETLAQAMGRDLTPGTGTWEQVSADSFFRCDGGYTEEAGSGSAPFPPQAPGTHLGQLETTNGYTTREATYGASMQNIRLRRSLDGNPNMAFSMSFLVEKTGLGAPIIEARMLTLAANALVSAGMIVLGAAPGASGDPVSHTAKRIDIVPDSTMFDAAGVAKLGDVVPSAKPDSTDRHFVTPLKSTEIPDEHVVLQAHGFSAADFTGTPAKVSWEGGISGTGAAANTVKVSRNKNGHTTIKLKPATGTAVVMHVWVVEARISATSIPFHESPTADGALTISGGFSFEHEILPLEMLDTAEIPNLKGPNETGAPGDVNSCGKSLLPGADHKWDNSRQIRGKMVNSHGFAIGCLDQLNSTYPTVSVVGDDDSRNKLDETNNPYPLGKLTGTDTPSRTWKETVGQNGNTIEHRLHFQEFTRLEINKKWFRVSVPKYWRVHFKFKKVSGKWVNNLSSKALDNAEF